MQPACSLHTIVCRRLQVAAAWHAACMQPACRLHFHSRRIFLASTPCMQPACSLHYASSVAASIEIHVHIPGVDAVCRASTPCIPGSTPCTPASTPCMQAASRLHAGRRRQENTPRMNMLILGVFFRAYFSIFRLWHDVMTSRHHTNEKSITFLNSVT